MDPVLVLSCSMSGLSVIRALGMKGIPVVALADDDISAIGMASKYVREKVRVPHPGKQEGELIDFLLQNAHRWPGALILDTTDAGAMALARHKHELSRHYKIVTAEWDILRKFIEKKETAILAEKTGVPHPKTLWPKSLDDLGPDSLSMNYPCIIKPVRSHEFYAAFKRKNFEVHSYDELIERFQFCQKHDHEVVIQEIIPGSDSEIYKCFFYIDSRGRTSGKFFYNKVRADPPRYGVNRVAISVPRNPEVEQLAERLLQGANYRGICTVEFKKDPRDGKLKLIEVNARMPRINWLPTFCGVNFPWLVYMDLVQGQPVTSGDYTAGAYWIELIPDLFNSLFAHKLEKYTLGEYLRPYLFKHKTFPDFMLDDLEPSIVRLGQTRSAKRIAGLFGSMYRALATKR